MISRIEEIALKLLQSRKITEEEATTICDGIKYLSKASGEAVKLYGEDTVKTAKEMCEK